MKTPDELIAEYKSAYLSANGRPLHSAVYERGWFRIQGVALGYVSKYRRKQIEAFRDELNRRAKEQS